MTVEKATVIQNSISTIFIFFIASSVAMQCHCILDNGNRIMHQQPISNTQFPEWRGSGLTVPEGEGLLYTAARSDMRYLAINEPFNHQILPTKTTHFHALSAHHFRRYSSPTAFAPQRPNLVGPAHMERPLWQYH